jgi:4-amino-4-deoxy-L-arabinose transferase-like glycosyltransferase
LEKTCFSSQKKLTMQRERPLLVDLADWRARFLLVALGLTLNVYLSTELLSLFGKLSLLWLAVWWALSLLVGIAAYLFSRKHKRLARILPLLSPGETFLYITLTVLVGVLLLLAIGTVPNTWDSMTYHLPRVMHWLQNQSVEHYPTAIPRQLYVNPLAEYIVLHLSAFSGAQLLSGFVQWCSYLGSIVGVSLIAAQLGASRQTQALSAVAAATLPMAVLQATSTQTDLFAAVWVVGFAAFGLMLNKNPRSWKLVLATGAFLGMAILAKTTNIFFVAPFLVWLGCSLIFKLRLRVIAVGLIWLVWMIILIGPFLVRNKATFGVYLGSQLEGGAYTLSNEHHSVGVVFSNTVRNLALELASPFVRINKSVENAVIDIHERLGLDVQDRRTTFFITQFHVPRSPYHEDAAGNPLHIVLGLAALVIVILKLRKRDTLLYTGSVVAGFVLFAAVMKWQPWHSRLLLPAMILGAPVLALGLSKIRPKFFYWILVLLLLLGAAGPLTQNRSRPLQGLFDYPRSQLFTQRKELQLPMSALSWAASRNIDRTGCKNIGLMLTTDAWEYPLWYLLDPARRDVRLEHIARSGQPASASLAVEQPSGFAPCLVVEVNETSAPLPEPQGHVLLEMSDVAYRVRLVRPD